MRSPAPALVAAAAPVLPSRAEIDAVVAMADPILRNLWITYTYHCLELALGEALGGGDLSWCAYGTWASKTAGRFIRGEVIPGLVHELVGRGSALLGRILAQVDRRIRGSVAEGNLKVFAEIGHEFARFCATCLENDAYDGAALDAFCAGLRPGDPPDGQHYLRAAFARYYDARFEPDAGRRAQLLLLANVEIGFHEQTRLQPEIVAAMEAPVIDPRQLRDRVLAALFPAERWSIRLRRAWDRLRGRPSPVDPAVDHLVAFVRDEARFLISDQLMAIELPQATRLRLGRDLRAEYPPSLQAITEPALRDLLARIDPTPDTPRESGAADWGDLADRLHFILELFRCYQEWPPLFDAPFTPAQVAALKAGSLPKGRL